MPFGSPNTAAALLQNTRLFFDFPLSLVGDANFEGFWRVEDGHITESGGVISQVDDQSGNGKHATQGTALARPALDDASFDQWAAEFDSSKVLEIPSTLANDGAQVMPSTGWTVWAVFQLGDTSGNQAIIGIGSTGGYAITMESVTWRIRHQGTGTANDGAADDTSIHLIEITRDGATDHMCVDGVEVSLHASPGTGTPSGASFLGALLGDLTFSMFGYLFEAAAMSRKLTGGAPGVGNPCTGESAQLWAYVQARYGL